jgi:hypothetical protein
MVESIDIMNVLIERRKSRRNDWKTLPSSFERDSVKMDFEDCKSHFTKREVGQRIKASKAQTFEELTASLL